MKRIPATKTLSKKNAATGGLRFLVFSLIPVLFLLLTAEAAVRLLGLTEPSYFIPSFARDILPHFRPDKDLGWALEPNASSRGEGNAIIRTNSLGLRSPEVMVREPGEYRILSLGESTTYGAFIPGNKTYSFQLQTYLNSLQGKRKFTVINAGVSAYSSTQSLRYLKLRGLDLEPDMVLFFHEVNDYLPTVIRAADMNEFGINKTDKELYGSRLQAVSAFFMNHWGVYRYLVFSSARRSMDALKSRRPQNPTMEIGLPDLRTGHEATVAEELSTQGFGRRVSKEERRVNLRELRSFCRERGIDLVIIHPAYRDSKTHQCVLTEFCTAEGVPMLEAQEILHPANLPAGYLFYDLWHPTEEGHRRLAGALAKLILSSGLVPE